MPMKFCDKILIMNNNMTLHNPDTDILKWLFNFKCIFNVPGFFCAVSVLIRQLGMLSSSAAAPNPAWFSRRS